MKKILVTILLIATLILPTAGCTNSDVDWAMSMIDAWLEGYELSHGDSTDAADAVEEDGVLLRLTFPAGYSPSVFTTGWVFGASCTVDGKDYSSEVTWSGSASFNPDKGSRSRPNFGGAGANIITLTVNIDGKEYNRTYDINAVSPSGYAHVGSYAKCDACAFGCPACPHTVTGPITTGSGQVFVNGKPAARVGDKGVAAASCGPAEFEITSGDSQVLIDGRPAAKIGSTTSHGGNIGMIISGGP